jgi:hypothetical protein
MLAAMSTSKVPHWVMIAAAIAAMSIAAVMSAQQKGDIALPVDLVAVLAVLNAILGRFTESYATAKEATKLRAESTPPPRGFVELRALLFVLGVGGIVVGGIGANCTPAQGIQVAVQVAVDVCQEAPQFLPPGKVSAFVALVCEYIDPATGAAKQGGQTVFISAVTWNAMKADYQKAHGHLPGGMSPVTP